MACLSVFAAIIWTLIRGRSGRWALMICAALWVVYAGCFYGHALVMEILQAYFRPYMMSSRIGGIIYMVLGVAASLATLAAYLAFPLAIRVALTLSDVRAKLEGKNAAES
jgi:hypothetical protein